jgi:hypothetical protein
MKKMISLKLSLEEEMVHSSYSLRAGKFLNEGEKTHQHLYGMKVLMAVN